MRTVRDKAFWCPDCAKLNYSDDLCRFCGKAGLKYILIEVQAYNIEASKGEMTYEEANVD